MNDTPGIAPLASDAGPARLTIAFATTVAMWAIGYLGRLPALAAPSAAVGILMLACVLGGGWVAGRYGRRGWLDGAVVGLIVGVLNLLILGSLLTGEDPNRIVPSALGWLPGSIVATALLGAIGAGIGTRRPAERPGTTSWTGWFVRVTAAATFLLLAVGGLVTSAEAGLAVVDWPNSYGYNMFLYPLSKMSGGIYYEHAHRLFGALVGLTTLVLAVVLQRTDPRPAVRRLGWVAFAMVVVQGLLGGLRVTGRFTLTTDPSEVAPSLALAVVHGVLGQVFFALVVGLAVATSPAWTDPAARNRSADPATDRKLGGWLVGLLLLQLVLGASQRHLAALLVFHIGLACLVAPLAILFGLRVWASNPSGSPLRRLGVALMIVTAVQFLLGIGAYVATGAFGVGVISPVLDMTVATAHQWCGALLLACAVATVLLSRRTV